MVVFVYDPDRIAVLVLVDNAVDRRSGVDLLNRDAVGIIILIYSVRRQRRHAVHMDNAVAVQVFQIGKRLRLQLGNGKDKAVRRNGSVSLCVILAHICTRLFNIGEHIMIVLKHNDREVGIGLVAGSDCIAILGIEEHDIALDRRFVNLRQADRGVVRCSQINAKSICKRYKVRQIRRKLGTGIAFLGRCILRSGSVEVALLSSRLVDAGGLEEAAVLLSSPSDVPQATRKSNITTAKIEAITFFMLVVPFSFVFA